MNIITRVIPAGEDELLRRERIAYFDEKDNVLSKGSVTERLIAFDGKYIKALLFGGIATEPQYRRSGCVRRTFETVLPQGRLRGCAFSLLHPFEFSYYNKFGFERVSDTVICDCTMASLDVIPRYPTLVPYDETRLDDLLAAYKAFALKRNLSFVRTKIEHFLRKPEWRLYLYYGEGGAPEGYLIYEKENHYDNINRMVSDNLHIWEIGYLNPAALQHELGFLRMFEGELDTIRFHDIGMSPEITLALRKYTQAKFDTHPDVMARILDIEAAFKAMAWPELPGTFTVKIKDTLPDVSGSFRVCYGNSTCTVEKIADDAPVDVALSAQALVRLMFGSDGYDADLAAYLPDATVFGNAETFFRAFPRRRVGIYEHF